MRPLARFDLVPALPALAALAGLAALSWTYLALPQTMAMQVLSGATPTPGGMSMPAAAWSQGAATWSSPQMDVLVMWVAMSVAMMLPVAAPTLIRLAGSGRGSALRVLAFAGSYLAPWLGFAAAATLLQWELERMRVLTGGVVTDPRVGSLVLAAVGVSQLLPLKRALLARCADTGRSAESSRGRNAALSGLRYAAPCLRVSGPLMLVPAAAGLMSAPWLALLTAWLLLERLSPRGGAFAALGGFGLIAFAAARLWTL